jgi:16S rRNA (guanine966-N2)-methyltransferase
MRIISGSAGRRHIRVPGSVARPSTDRLREALFSILADRVRDAQVMDLFAGSGALGLESLSRGASCCVFVDQSRESQKVIGQNLKDLELDGGRVLGGDVFQVLKSERADYDLIFADPPYFKSSGDVDYVERLLVDEHLPGCLAQGGLLVVEDSSANERGGYEGWELLDQRRYGGSGILFYQRQTSL